MQRLQNADVGFVFEEWGKTGNAFFSDENTRSDRSRFEPENTNTIYDALLRRAGRNGTFIAVKTDPEAAVSVRDGWRTLGSEPDMD